MVWLLLRRGLLTPSSCMDTPSSDLQPNPLEDAPSPETIVNRTGTRTRISRITSHALAELWKAKSKPGEPTELPGSLTALGDALRRAVESGGAVGQAYIAFADQAIAAPSTLPAFSEFVTLVFADEQGVLINLVRTMDLIVELEHGGNKLTRMVALRWQAGTMTQRISRFGESLVNHQERLNNPVAAEVLAVFAGLLALSKPKRAAGLLQLAIKISDPPAGQDVIDNVRSWLAAGELIDPMSPEDRAFWQLCLHQSETDTTWSSAEACSALNALAGQLKLEMPCAALFQQLVPSSWWARQMAGQSAAEPVIAAVKADTPAPSPPAPAPTPPAPDPPSVAKPPDKPGVTAAPPVVMVPTSNTMPFLTGQLLGMVIVAGIWVIQPDLLPRALGAAQHRWFGVPTVATSDSTAGKVSTASVQAHGTTPPASQAPPVQKALPISAGDVWRLSKIASLASSHAAMKPWVTKVQDSTWAESAQLVGGTHPTAYPTVQDYRVFLTWLMLDPPHNSEVRHAVPKHLLRASPLPDLIDLCEHLNYPGSPAAQDIPTLAQIAMEMHSGVLTTGEQQRLQKLASAH